MADAYIAITHPDGTICIWMDETQEFFVPIDAGGEGHTCPADHPFAPTLTQEWAVAYEHRVDPTMDNPSGIRTQRSTVVSRDHAEQAVASLRPVGSYNRIENARVEVRLVTPWTTPTPASTT